MKILGSDDHVIVVGAGLAGWRFAEALRREGYLGALSMVGDEPHLPYDRPPLSKQVLSGKWDVERTTLVEAERLAELDIVTHWGTAAVSLDPETASVTLASGRVLEGTFVVVATGTRARRLPFHAADHLHTLRTRDDVVTLRDSLSLLESGATVAIIGGGFIGAEAATALSALGFQPVVLEAAPLPLVAVLGTEVAEWLARLPSDVGVELRVDQSITDVVSAEGGYDVLFADGSRLFAGAVVLGVGAVPNTEWLAGSRVEVMNGVVVNDHLFAREDVAAIGDVARFPWRHGGERGDVRIEHWQTANDHAQALAAMLTRAGSETDVPIMVPYFWSDQYGKKIQMLGHPAPTDQVTRVVGSPDEGKWLALYSRADVVTGLIALNQPRGLMLSRGLLESDVTLAQALATAPWSV